MDELSVARRIILDLRTFNGSPLTRLNDFWKGIFRTWPIAGVVLFAENCESSEQVKALCCEIQSASINGALGHPCLIAIDQEGGRVMRTHSAMTTAMPGAMSIAATGGQAASHAEFVAKHMALELNELGINWNFAPCVDVNSDPRNPVINVRSFSSDARRVVELAERQLQGFRAGGVLNCIKHFPGHGNTSIDSHVGLASTLAESFEEAMNEAEVFNQLIRGGNVDAVMTAHLQSPYLDDSTLSTKGNESCTVPATFSSRILIDLLRDDFRFDGVVISDALDMGAVAEHFTPSDALCRTLQSGCDLALMPLAIDCNASSETFERLLKSVSRKLQESSGYSNESALRRIEALHHRIRLSPSAIVPREVKEQAARRCAEIWHQSITEVAACPLVDVSQSVAVYGPESLAKRVIEVLRKYNIMAGFEDARAQRAIVLSMFPFESPVEAGGLATFHPIKPGPTVEDTLVLVNELLVLGKQVDVFSFRSPEWLGRLPNTVGALACYDYRLPIFEEACVPVIESLCKIWAQNLPAPGVLPVNLLEESA
ncbi:MAG: glycoside hydrolase family 3 protein [Gammaproteobacteria bacterium]|nr:glycoside hydrolase family 3 protein [Gammaproteobacteria bacterium]